MIAHREAFVKRFFGRFENFFGELTEGHFSARLDTGAEAFRLYSVLLGVFLLPLVAQSCAASVYITTFRRKRKPTDGAPPAGFVVLIRPRRCPPPNRCEPTWASTSWHRRGFVSCRPSSSRRRCPRYRRGEGPCRSGRRTTRT